MVPPAGGAAAPPSAGGVAAGAAAPPSAGGVAAGAAGCSAAGADEELDSAEVVLEPSCFEQAAIMSAAASAARTSLLFIERYPERRSNDE